MNKEKQKDLSEARDLVIIIINAIKMFAKSGQTQILHFKDARITIEKEKPYVPPSRT